jgi:hypothetical protein
MSANRDDGKDTPLRLVDLRLNLGYFRTGGHSAAGTTGSDRRAPAMHRHVAGTFLIGRCGGQARQDASQNRRQRPKQDGTDRNASTSSTHSH